MIYRANDCSLTKSEADMKNIHKISSLYNSALGIYVVVVPPTVIVLFGLGSPLANVCFYSGILVFAVLVFLRIVFSIYTTNKCFKCGGDNIASETEPLGFEDNSFTGDQSYHRSKEHYACLDCGHKWEEDASVAADPPVSSEED